MIRKFPMKTTNFDRYLEEQRKDPEFNRRFRVASKSWETSMHSESVRTKPAPCRTRKKKMRTPREQLPGVLSRQVGIAALDPGPGAPGSPLRKSGDTSPHSTALFTNP